MKSLKLRPGKFPKNILLPGSKSYANRVLILAALKPGSFTLKNLPESTDVTTLVACLRELGLMISLTENSCIVGGSFPDCETSPKKLFVGEGGTTARFLACALLKGSQAYTLVLGERLKLRPWQEFIDLVTQHGGVAELHDNLLKVQGPVTFPETLEIDCQRTTQFASGIQLAYSEVIVIPKNLNSSSSYWKMTQELQRNFDQTDAFSVPLDWSSASYPLAFGALSQEMFFPELQEDRFQSDSKFYQVLRNFDALESTQKGTKVYPSKVSKNLEMDVSDCLDLVPALSFFLAHIPGEHHLSGIENLIHKESDRLSEITKLLSVFERKTSVQNNKLTIWGSDVKVKESKVLNFPDDHRMVMTGALFLLFHSGGSLAPVSAVDKSYPRFFDLLADSIVS